MLDSNKPISIYLSHLGVTENLTQTQVIPYLEGIASHFQQPIVLLTHEKSVLNRKAKTKIREPLLQKGIIWKSVSYHSSTQGWFFSAKIRDLYYSFVQVKELLRQYNSIRIIHVRSYFHTPLALYFCKFSLRHSHNFKFLWDIRGFYLDEYVEMNLGRKGFFYYFLKRFEKYVFGKCDALVVLTQQTISALSELNYSFPDNCAVIPTSISAENFPVDDYFAQTNRLLLEKILAAKSFAKEKLAEKLEINLADKTVLVYSGSLGEMYCEAEMATFFQQLSQKYVELNSKNKLFFLILTKSSPTNLQKHLEEFGFQIEKDFKFLGVQPNQMKDYLLAADFGLNFAKHCLANRARCSTKFAEYLACGVIPISNQGIGDIEVYSQQFSTSLLIEKYRFVAQNFENEIKQMIQIEFDDELKANILSQSISLSQTKFSMKKAVEKYAEVYRSLG